MSLFQRFLHVSNFRSPLLRTLVPSVAAAYAIQTAVAIPSIAAKSELFYDVSGSVTFLAVTALSLYLPALRARSAAAGKAVAPLPSLLAPFTDPAAAGLNWRQVVLSGAVSIWAARLGSYLFQRILGSGQDSRFEKIKPSPFKFFFVWMAQATWVSICLAPVIAINSAPVTAFALLPRATMLTDALGIALFAGGFAFEVKADRQKSKWMAEKKKKVHDEEFMTRGLWSRSQYPNYFGESTLWTGIATLAAGALVTHPMQVALGLSGVSGKLSVLAMAYASPAFVTFLLTKVSGIPMSEKKYDKRYGNRKDYQEWKRNTPKFFPRLT